MLSHKYIIVNTDQLDKYRKENGFYGDLSDYAAHVFNKWKADMMPNAKVIGIESNHWADEIRPIECNSATWYKRYSLKISVWLESDRPVPRPIRLTDEGIQFMALNNKSLYTKAETIWIVSDIDNEGYAEISLYQTPVMTYRLHKDYFEILDD